MYHHPLVGFPPHQVGRVVGAGPRSAGKQRPGEVMHRIFWELSMIDFDTRYFRESKRHELCPWRENPERERSRLTSRTPGKAEYDEQHGWQILVSSSSAPLVRCKNQLSSLYHRKSARQVPLTGIALLLMILDTPKR